MKKTNPADLTTILIAGGVSERMWPFTDKCFISFVGKALLSHAIAQLERVGLKKIVIVGNHLNLPQIKSLSPQFPRLSIEIVLQEGKGMARAFVSAYRAGIRGPIIVRTPHDIIDDEGLTALFNCLGEDLTGAILGKKMDKYFPGGYIVEKDHFIQQIIEKPTPNKQPSDMVTIVTHYFANPQKFVKTIETIRSEKDDLYELALSKMIQSGAKIKCVPYVGPWAYLKYPWHILDVSNHFLSLQKTRVAASAKIHPTVTIRGAVVIEDGVIVNPHSTIVGPAYIGRNTIVGNNTLVRQAHIGANCVIGFSTEVVRSYIGDNTWFHTNYVGDSAVGTNVSLGSGAVLANFRLDEEEVFSTIKKQKITTSRNKLGAMIGDNVRIGVNASIMPGVKIGRGSFIGAGTVLTEDVPDDMLVFAKQQLEVRKNSQVVNQDNRQQLRSKL